MCILGTLPTVCELQLMDCFTYADGVMMLKLPSSKLIKSDLNSLKPPALLDPLLPRHLA